MIVSHSSFRSSAMTAVLLLLATTTTMMAGAQTYAPVTTVDINAYMGRWYQMAANKGFILLELGGNCVTADYTLRTDGKVALVNQARPLLIPRWLARTSGFVVQSDQANEQGAFTVKQQYLFSINPDTVEYEAPGSYWIVGLGPIVDGQYQWAAVSNSDKGLSFILARDVEEYNQGPYKADAKLVFESIGGFDKFGNKPIDTSHFLCFGYKDAIFT